MDLENPLLNWINSIPYLDSCKLLPNLFPKISPAEVDMYVHLQCTFTHTTVCNMYNHMYIHTNMPRACERAWNLL